MEGKYLQLLNEINKYEGGKAFTEESITNAETKDGVVMVEVGNALGKVRATFKQADEDGILTIETKNAWEDDWTEKQTSTEDKDFIKA